MWAWRQGGVAFAPAIYIVDYQQALVCPPPPPAAGAIQSTEGETGDLSKNAISAGGDHPTASVGAVSATLIYLWCGAA